MQHELTALGYWLGPVNGTFGDSAQQAAIDWVWARGLLPMGSRVWIYR